MEDPAARDSWGRMFYPVFAFWLALPRWGSIPGRILGVPTLGAAGAVAALVQTLPAARIGMVTVEAVSEEASIWQRPSKMPPGSMTMQGA